MGDKMTVFKPNYILGSLREFLEKYRFWASMLRGYASVGEN